MMKLPVSVFEVLQFQIYEVLVLYVTIYDLLASQHRKADAWSCAQHLGNYEAKAGSKYSI